MWRSRISRKGELRCDETKGSGGVAKSRRGVEMRRNKEGQREYGDVTGRESGDVVK